MCLCADRYKYYPVQVEHSGGGDKVVKERLLTMGKKVFAAIDLANYPSLTVWLVWSPVYRIVCCLYCLECAVQKNAII